MIAKIRALRRKNKARFKKKARKIYPHDVNGKLANHLKVCSCFMCGNFRKNNGPTIKELRYGNNDEYFES